MTLCDKLHIKARMRFFSHHNQIICIFSVTLPRCTYWCGVQIVKDRPLYEGFSRQVFDNASWGQLFCFGARDFMVKEHILDRF